MKRLITIASLLLVSCAALAQQDAATPQEQTPVLFEGANTENAVADLGKLLGSGGELLDPARMKRVVFRADSPGHVKDLAGYRKTHTLLRGAGVYGHYVDQDQTIEVDENTSFRKQGESITLPDIKVGDKVFGRGEMKNETFVPQVLNVGDLPQMRIMRQGTPNEPLPKPDSPKDQAE